jgi:hypothetical protein
MQHFSTPTVALATSLWFAPLCMPAFAGDPVATNRPLTTVRSAITADDVRSDVTALASDDMGGRFFRSPFAEKAAVWITGKFTSIGLTPGVTSDSFRQPIDKNPETGPNLVAVFPGPVSNGSAVAGAGTGYIIVSAHYDHMRPRRSGDDKIYNGADDNASGVAGMLAVARAMKACSAAGQGPACTVIFIAFNGEEAGLLGSMAYAKSPTVPLAEIRGMFNMDMISRGPARQIYIDGGEIGAPVTAALRSANEAIGLKLRTDEHPDWLNRSDQGPFLAKKVPAVLFSVEDHEDYHQVTDEVAKIDASLAAEVAQLVALAAIDMSRQAFVPRVAVPAATPGSVPTPAKAAPAPDLTPAPSAAPAAPAPSAPSTPHAP